MADPSRKVGPEKGTMGEILLHVPGFKGYLKAEYRREADKKQRDYLADRLKGARKALEAVKTVLSQKAIFGPLKQLESLTDRIYRVTSQIEQADRGYSGFFASNVIDDRKLQEIYQIDLDLVSEVEALEVAVRGVDGSAPESEVTRAMQDVEVRIGTLDQKFEQRKLVLRG